jgi:rhamnogalacturonan endolyase
MKIPGLAILAAVFLLPALLAAAPAVTVSEDDNFYTLANGLLTAKVSKISGDLTSLVYSGREMLDTDPGKESGGYWEQNTTRGVHVNRVTINPGDNGGRRGEVSVKGIYSGTPLGNGPGGSTSMDVEIRYTLNQGSSGLYTYAIFEHRTNYPATSIGESRFCLKLNDGVFDWMTVDANRNFAMITAYDWNHGTVMNMKEARRMNSGIYQGQVEHKYDYSANQFSVRTWGWSSTSNRVGLWFINPSVEYLSGGPTKVELSAHRDATFTGSLTAPAPPTLLNYWRGSHYGGSICNVAAAEAWSKVIGPFLIYCNAGKSHNALWQEALTREKTETAQWPYDWVNGVDYPHENERATVSGKLILKDPRAPKVKMGNLLVGLTAPDYVPSSLSRNPGGGRRGGRTGGGGGGGGFSLSGGGEDEAAMTNQISFPDAQSAGGGSPNRGARPGTNGLGGRGGPNLTAGFGSPRMVDWQNDAKNYEFWVHGDANGNFRIPNVRPGRYTLHAIADGVLGEFAVSNIVVASGKKLDLGNQNWQPVRHGRQVWDIGIPNRTGSEFFKGDDYFHWGWYLEYPKLFPNDVNYVIGRSDFRKDWFFEQVPHNEDPGNTTGTGRGRATPWSVTFNLPAAPHGRATLRLAICGVGTRSIAATMNDQSLGEVTGLAYNATLNRDGIGGYWSEHDIVFDASVMKAGENVLKLTVPAGTLTSGIIYDYLRLEVDENAPAPN